MFKNILPSKRIASTDFTMVTPLVENGKENQPGPEAIPNSTKNAKPGLAPTKGFRKRADMKEKDTNRTPAEMNQAFDDLLDELQIPSTLRPKLAGMDNSVKAAMLKSSQGMTLNLKSTNSPPMTPRSSALRRTRSIESLDSPRVYKNSIDSDLLPPRPPFAANQLSSQHSSSVTSSSPRKASHSRGISLGTGFMSRSQVNLNASSSVLDLNTLGKQPKEKEKGPSTGSRTLSPQSFVSLLQGTSSTDLDIESVKKLRLLLRNESANWTQDFLRLSGYSALLTRLNEILEVEWREEQHDDQVLHELLRCFKALSTSSIGCFALRSSSPTPFFQLVSLLYSDKKPGDVATRQLMVEMLSMLFELYPASSLPAMNSRSEGMRSRREIWETESSTSSNLITLPAPHKSIYSFIRSLLLTPAPPSSEAPAAPVSPHEFIENLHRPRIYKTYLQELSDVCRDYFWVFCHPNNTIWIMAQTDEARVEKPRAPGGMTGGVEFEAMNYLTTHLRFINAIAKAAEDLSLPKENDLSAYRFHADLFLSGFERLILISRKASTTYYPTLHLELARYVVLAGRAGFELPWTLSRLMGSPPAALCKTQPSATPSGSVRTSVAVPGSPSRRAAKTSLPPPAPQTPPRRTESRVN
ncbi:hypothetical protein D9758_013127 [Tetrapyrgos nigripes]|uniref:Formin GTPase-binding domain-containing protein n=1 Tax=Tetrapyrgos nigripes TaxID=182062 RepID=A0A8H5CAZ4_9AGAR|nr:hypothetical protein D9758_013127 [Tetrapyrgos nigripes]